LVGGWVAERFEVDGIQQRRAPKRLYAPDELAEVLDRADLAGWSFQGVVDGSGRIRSAWLERHHPTG
jgi:hypothetical protein